PGGGGGRPGRGRPPRRERRRGRPGMDDRPAGRRRGDRRLAEPEARPGERRSRRSRSGPRDARRAGRAAPGGPAATCAGRVTRSVRGNAATLDVVQVHRSRRSATVVEVMLWVAAFGLVGATVVYSLGPAPAALHAFPLADKVC